MSEAGEYGSLAALLRARVSAECRAPLDAVDGLEALLQGYFDAGRTAWPEVPLTPERFVEHLARHLSAQGTDEVLHRLHGADLYLACACAMGDRQALLAFEQHIIQKVSARLRSLPGVAVDDVMQLLRQRLLLGKEGAPPKIMDYSGRGPLLAWVGISAKRLAGALANREGRHELFDEPPDALVKMLAPDDPERELLKEDSRHSLAMALRKALERLPERERALLRLHHVHGLSMDRLSAMYGESRSGVARRVAQAREELLKLTREELAARLKLAPLELDSLLGLVRSRLDFSVDL